jgi:hypothetical protein
MTKLRNADIDLLFQVNSLDIEALTDAQFTLEAIKNADPGTYDEIIDESLRLIKNALNTSCFESIERLADNIGVEI